MPFGAIEGRDQPQPLEYLLAEGRDVPVALADVERELTLLDDVADSLEATTVLGEIRERLDGLGETSTVRDVGLRLEQLVADRGDRAATDVVALVATRLLRYTGGPSQERERF